MLRLHVKVATLLAGLLIALAGCASAPARVHELRLTLPIDPASLSPIYAFNQDQIALDLLWCQTLVGLDERNRFVPVLVTRIPSRQNGDISGDGLRITYHLRPGVRFADGAELTSADVAFTYRAILDPTNSASTIGDYERIAALTTPDPRTVVIRLRSPWAAAVHVLFAQADEAFGILPRHAFSSTKVTASTWDDRPFGTGPFRVVSWERGNRIVLEPNPYFLPQPKLSRIVMRIYPDATTAFNALQTDSVDQAPLTSDTFVQAARIAKLRIERTPENGLLSLYVQTAAGPTRDIRVRRAIAFALDRQAISTAWHRILPLADSVFPAPLVSWRAAAPAPYRYDVAQANRELDAAGWELRGATRVRNGKPLEFVLALEAARPNYARIAVAVQQQLAAIGADVVIKPYATALLSAPDGPERTGRFGLLIGGFIGGSDPEQSLNLSCAQARPGGGNYARYCSPAFERLLRQQRIARSDTERQADFNAIARRIRNDLPLIPLYDFVNIEAVDRRVTGYRRNMLRFAVHPEDWDVR